MMKDNSFIFDHADSLYYICHRIKPNPDRAYMDSLNWIKANTKMVIDVFDMLKDLH